jgi:cytochrome P450
MQISQVSTPVAPAGAESGGESAPRIPPILARLLPRTLKDKIVYHVLHWGRDYPQCRWVYALARSLPILTLGKFMLVFRYDEVREVLGRHADFEVPFGEKMENLNGGPNFLLGMKTHSDEDRRVYERCQQLVMAAFSRADLPKITDMAWRYAKEEIAKALKTRDRTIDAMRDLLTLVATRMCKDYYGVTIEDKDMHAFAAWTMAMSVFLFGPPTKPDDPAYKQAAEEGAQFVRQVVDCAIAKAQKGHFKPGTVLARLIEMQKQHRSELTDAVVRSYLIGMITGFVPTSSVATGNILEMLLRRPDFMDRARKAAKAGDDDLLKRCLFEALRFKPINPGPFRVCREETFIGKGTPREKKVPKGKILFASTQSAMLDGDGVSNPNDFDPGRPGHHYMTLGYGLHWCTGALIAEAHATQVFKALLQTMLERVPGERGKLEVVGVLPLHLEVRLVPEKAA